MWAALDIFVGLALCYAMVSLICSVIQEFIAQALNSRGRMLLEALKSVNLEKAMTFARQDLVGNPSLWSFWNWGRPGHQTRATTEGNVAAMRVPPALNGTPRPPRLPHDIPADIFARAVIAHIGWVVDDKGQINRAEVDAKLDTLPPALRNQLKPLLDQGIGAIDTVTAVIAAWYNDFIAQVDHWYTRRAQVASLVIGLAVALALKVDTIGLATSLHESSVQRAAVVALADSYAKDGRIAECATSGGVPDAAATDAKTIGECAAKIQQAYPLPLGWKAKARPGETSIHALWYEFWTDFAWLGIIISGLALSLGSRFWFDQLKTLVALRTGGQPPEDRRK